MTTVAAGVRLVGHLLGVDGSRAQFAADLVDSVAGGDARYDDVRRLPAERLGDEAPTMPDPEPFHRRRRCSVSAPRGPAGGTAASAPAADR